MHPLVEFNFHSAAKSSPYSQAKIQALSSHFQTSAPTNKPSLSSKPSISNCYFSSTHHRSKISFAIPNSLYLNDPNPSRTINSTLQYCRQIVAEFSVQKWGFFPSCCWSWNSLVGFFVFLNLKQVLQPFHRPPYFSYIYIYIYVLKLLV